VRPEALGVRDELRGCTAAAAGPCCWRLQPTSSLPTRTGSPARRLGEGAVIGVNVTFDYTADFDRARIIKVAENARGMFEGCSRAWLACD
jgi:hypothetical protein